MDNTAVSDLNRALKAGIESGNPNFKLHAWEKDGHIEFALISDTVANPVQFVVIEYGEFNHQLAVLPPENALNDEG